MDEDMRFLGSLKENLLEAAWRESFPTHGRRHRAFPSFSRRGATIALASLILLVSAGIGYRVLGHPSVNRMTGAFSGVVHKGTIAQRAPVAGPVPLAGNAFGPHTSSLADQGVSLGSINASGSTTTAPGAPGSAGSGAAPTYSGTSQPLVPGVSLTKIIKTASMSVVVPRGGFSNAYRAATQIASTNGGYLQNSSTSGTRSGSLTVLVPQSNFEAALGALRALGSVSSESVNGQDVTSQFVDLGARLQIAQSREAALLRMMAHASGISETLQLENVLNDTQTQIEQIKGELNVLKLQTSMGTISVDIREVGVKVGPTPVTVHNPSVLHGLHLALSGLLGVVIAVIVGLGYLIPIGIVAAAVFFVARRLRRRAPAGLIE